MLAEFIPYTLSLHLVLCRNGGRGGGGFGGGGGGPQSFGDDDIRAESFEE